MREARFVEGVARCSRCRWTHPFSLELPERIEVPAVVSRGPRSERLRVWLSTAQRLLVGSRVPDQVPPLRILRMDLKDGSRAPDALAREVRTLWLAPDEPRPIPVSLVLGGRTAVSRLEVGPEQMIAVGGTVVVAGGRMRVTGLRARHRTWSEVGDRFPASEVARIYTRRIESPPAGSNRWRSARDRPSSRAISSSRSERARSSPGVRMRRNRPWARRASGGAVVHASSPS
jgi:uncharacterized Zn finger protein